ncbi:MAG: PAS domain S-box protein [Candidatus Taylorbacteria bacterium]
MRIRRKIAVSFVSGFIIILSLLMLVLGVYTTSIIRANVYSYLQASNISKAEHLKTFIQDQQKTAVILAASSVYRDFLLEPINSKQYSLLKGKIDKRLIRTIESDPEIYESMIIDARGVIVASSIKTNEKLDKSGDEYFTKAKEGVYIKDMYFSEIDGRVNYTVSAPIIADDGKFLGVTVVRYLPEHIYKIVNSSSVIGQSEENLLVNKDGLFITPSVFLGSEAVLKQKDTSQVNGSCSDRRGIDSASKSDINMLKGSLASGVTEVTDYRGVQVVETNVYIPDTGWCLITKVDVSEALSFRYNMIWYYILAALFAEIIFIAVSYYVSRKITSPIEALHDAVDKVSPSSLDFKPGITSNDEIGKLSGAFGDMVLAVKQALNDTKQKVIEQTSELNAKTIEADLQKTAVLNILEDVEVEKKKTEQLASDLLKFRLAVDNAIDQVVITDVEGIVIYGNSAVEKITGYKPEEALGKKAAVLWKVPMPNDYYKDMWDTIKIQKKPFIGEIRNKKKNGDVYTAIISISPVLDDKGDIIFFVAIERDITDRKKNEEQVKKLLADTQEQAKSLDIARLKDDAILEGIGDGIITTNEDGIITLVNESALEMFGYKSEEMINKQVVEIMRITDETREEISMKLRPITIALETGKKTSVPLGSTYYYSRKDGTRFPSGITVTPFRLDGKIMGTIEVFRDITIEKDIDKAKTEFVSLASHQLRTPLSAIGWYTEMLLDGDAGKISVKQKDYLNEIYNGNKRMVNLVTSLLNVSRIELGTFSVEPELTDIREIVQSVVDEMKPMIVAKKMDVKLDIEEGLEKIMVDQKLIRMVYQNLTSNALKYTGEGGHITIEVKVKDNDLLSSVSDNGFGIPKSQQSGIFQKLFRADNAKTQDADGTGLGLYIIKSIIEQSSNGKMWFESIENKGTTFYFTIPKSGVTPKKGSRPLGS